MVLGDNKGIIYEKKIFEILKERNLVASESSAGAGPGADIVFIHRGKKFRLEAKINITDPDYGQKRLIPKKEGSGWKWTWAIDEEITRYYTESKVLEYLNAKKIVPNKYRKPDDEITMDEKREDMTNFEDPTFVIPTDAFTLFYRDKADYLQVGNGYGFYHLSEDVANLGTEKFEGKFILRFRVKTHHSKPIFNYSFFAVLKCKGANKKSKYNIEDYSGQKFPKIQL